MAALLERLRKLYKGSSERARRFRYGLVAFDLVTILFVVVTTFVPRAPLVVALDLALGVLILADFLARLAIEPRKLRYLARPTTIVDILVVISFLAPLPGEGFGFLRVLRTLRLVRSYQLLRQLRGDIPFFRKNEDVVLAAINLGVFLFVMTGVIYVTQHLFNPQIGNYADALYFTVTTLTTTGFGDVTLTGTSGRMLSVVVMIVGVTLFLRLVQVLLRPPKVRHTCPECALMLHDIDAVHCKHCGHILKIKDEGAL